MGCKIGKSRNGKINKVLDAAGQKSNLFQQILNIPTLSLNEAIEAYKNVYGSKLKGKVRFEQRGGIYQDRFTRGIKPEKIVVLFNKNSVLRKLVDNDISSTLNAVENYVDLSLPFSPTILELSNFVEILGNAVDNELLNYDLIREETNVTEADIKELLKIAEKN